MSDVPETKYAKTPDGLRIAYQVVGDGPIDIVLQPTHLAIDVMWEEPSFRGALNRLSDVGRLICLDARGSGTSDPVPLGALPTPEAWMDDTRVVMDAVGSERATILADVGAGFVPVLFAATYPERTSAIVLVSCFARYRDDDGYVFGNTSEVEKAILSALGAWRGTGAAWPSSRPVELTTWGSRAGSRAMSARLSLQVPSMPSCRGC